MNHIGPIVSWKSRFHWFWKIINYNSPSDINCFKISSTSRHGINHVDTKSSDLWNIFYSSDLSIFFNASIPISILGKYWIWIHLIAECCRASFKNCFTFTFFYDFLLKCPKIYFSSSMTAKRKRVKRLSYIQ